MIATRDRLWQDSDWNTNDYRDGAWRVDFNDFGRAQNVDGREPLIGYGKIGHMVSAYQNFIGAHVVGTGQIGTIALGFEPCANTCFIGSAWFGKAKIEGATIYGYSVIGTSVIS